MAKTKYYVVWKGRQTGIFNTWDECSAQVSGYPQAEYKAFDSLSAAQAAFRQKYGDYKGRPASLGNWRSAATKPLLPSISVDAACGGSPGPLEDRGVETETSKQVFKSGLYSDGTNTVGEILAIVQALACLHENNLNSPAHSDSE